LRRKASSQRARLILPRVEPSSRLARTTLRAKRRSARSCHRSRPHPRPARTGLKDSGRSRPRRRCAPRRPPRSALGASRGDRAGGRSARRCRGSESRPAARGSGVTTTPCSARTAPCRVDAALGPAQHRRQRDHHDLVELVALGVAATRALKRRKTRPKPIHAVLRCNRNGTTKSSFLHKENPQISCAIPRPFSASQLTTCLIS
jgi:hypothetical protein